MLPGFRTEKTFYAGDELLRLKRFANQFIGADGDRFVGNALVDHTGHQNHGNAVKLRMLLDLAADRVAVLIGHDDVGDDCVGRILFELCHRGGGVARGNHRDVLPAESNLDDFTHGGAVVNEIDGVGALCWRGSFHWCWWQWHGLAHNTSSRGVTTGWSTTWSSV